MPDRLMKYPAGHMVDEFLNLLKWMFEVKPIADLGSMKSPEDLMTDFTQKGLRALTDPTTTSCDLACTVNHRSRDPRCAYRPDVSAQHNVGNIY